MYFPNWNNLFIHMNKSAVTVLFCLLLMKTVSCQFPPGLVAASGIRNRNFGYCLCLFQTQTVQIKFQKTRQKIYKGFRWRYFEDETCLLNRILSRMQYKFHHPWFIPSADVDISGTYSLHNMMKWRIGFVWRRWLLKVKNNFSFLCCLFLNDPLAFHMSLPSFRWYL